MDFEVAHFVITELGLEAFLDRDVMTLSGGERQRVAIARALTQASPIVLLDEPTASLDPDVSLDVCKFLLEQREKTGLSILFTSHKMEEVADLCDRTIFLQNGKIIADDLPENLAKSVSSHQIILTIGDGMKRTKALAEKRGLAYQCEHRKIELFLDEKEIPLFLNALMHEGVSYLTIQIKEPSLEKYFLQIAERSK